jgi:hypothetical protein
MGCFQTFMVIELLDPCELPRLRLPLGCEVVIHGVSVGGAIKSQPFVISTEPRASCVVPLIGPPTWEAVYVGPERARAIVIITVASPAHHSGGDRALIDSDIVTSAKGRDS